MPRIRTIKPELWESKTLAALDYVVVLTFIGLFNHVDDDGRCKDLAALVKAAVHPLREDLATSDVEAHLVALAGAGAVCRYSVGEDGYLHLPFFKQNQVINRPRTSKIPPCPRHDGDAHGALTESSVHAHGAVREPSRSPHGALTPGREGSGEGQGGEGEPPRPPDATPTPSTSTTTTTTTVDPHPVDPRLMKHPVDQDLVDDLVAAHASTSKEATTLPKEAALRQQITALLVDGSDPLRLRVAVEDLARKGYSPKALPKFLAQVRVPASPARTATATRSLDAWSGAF